MLRELIFILISCVFFGSNALADRSTKNNYTGGWGNDASWTGGSAPDFVGLPSPTDENYTINGYISAGSYTSNQNLTFRANEEGYDLTINDTLVVYGDVDFANKSMNLVINNGGFLIILGDLEMNNKIDVAADGHLIVSGNFNKTGSQGNYAGSGNVYAGSYTGDASDLVPDSQEKNTGSDLNSDFPDIFDFINDGGSNPLPVEVAYFNAAVEQNQVILHWATTMEENFDYFTVERSADGYEFNSIGNVYSSEGGTSEKFIEYEFADEAPLQGYSYYRLKATDFDGFTEYHGVVSVKTEGVEDKMRIFPNPSTGHEVEIDFNGRKDSRYKLVSFTGEIIDTGILKTGLNQVRFNQALSPGIYFIYLDKSPSARPVKLVVR